MSKDGPAVERVMQRGLRPWSPSRLGAALLACAAVAAGCASMSTPKSLPAGAAEAQVVAAMGKVTGRYKFPLAAQQCRRRASTRSAPIRIAGANSHHHPIAPVQILQHLRCLEPLRHQHRYDRGPLRWPDLQQDTPP